MLMTPQRQMFLGTGKLVRHNIQHQIPNNSAYYQFQERKVDKKCNHIRDVNIFF